jgi:hypothetical protein
MQLKELQQFLSLLDTVHDYGNTGRVKNVIKKKTDKGNVNAQDFNPAFIIDFLMLAYVHNHFRDLIGLSQDKHYLLSDKYCNDTKYVKSSNTNTNKTDAIGNLICKEFYYPTYGDKVIFRSPDPEELTKKVLFAYLKSNVVYDETQQVDWDKIDRNVPCATFNIGNIGVDEKKVKYQSDIQKNRVKKLDCVKDVNEKEKTYVSTKKDNTGIHNIEDVNSQGTELYEKLKVVFGCEELTYVTDANKLNMEWFCVTEKQSTHYKGMFVQFDSFKQGKETTVGGAPSKEKRRPKMTEAQNAAAQNAPNAQVVTIRPVQCKQKEFQNYSLTSNDGELLNMKKLFVDAQNNEVNHITSSISNGKLVTRTYECDISNGISTNSKVPRGLSLFVLLFNEINKKTLGYKDIDKGTVNTTGLKNDINKIGLASLRDTYQVSLSVIDDNKDYALLEPVEFVLTLFDLKRSMDYLYVKACSEANKKQDPKQRKYVFVSSDRSAICYSLLLNNPCILTIPVSDKDDPNCDRGEQKVIVYNPPQVIPQTRQQVQVQPKNILAQAQVKPQTKQHAQAQVKPQTKQQAQVEPGYEEKVKFVKALVGFDRIIEAGNEIGVDKENEDRIERIKKITVKAAADQLANLTMDQCSAFLQEYNNRGMNASSKIVNPITKRSVSKDNATIKTIYTRCSNMQKEVAEREKKEKEARQFAEDLEKEEISALEEDMENNITNIIETGIRIKSDSRKHFGQAQIEKLLKEKKVPSYTFCEYLEKNKDKEFVKNFNEKVNFAQRSKVCPDIQAGGKWNNANNIRTYLQNANNAINSKQTAKGTQESILTQDIPLNDLESICEFGSPMYIFFQFYSQLTPTISFFWFITFKSLLFFTFGDDMDRADCVKFATMNDVNTRYNVQQTSSQAHANVRPYVQQSQSQAQVNIRPYVQQSQSQAQVNIRPNVRQSQSQSQVNVRPTKQSQSQAQVDIRQNVRQSQVNVRPTKQSQAQVDIRQNVRQSQVNVRPTKQSQAQKNVTETNGRTFQSNNTVDQQRNVVNQHSINNKKNSTNNGNINVWQHRDQ